MGATQTALSWGDIIRLALSAGVVSALLGQGLIWLREWHTRKTTDAKEARHVALRAAIHLETFVMSCAELAADNDLHDGSGGHAGTTHTSLAELPPFPDLEWKALDIALQARILAFPIEVTSAQQGVAFYWQVEGEDEVADECVERAARLGLRAWALACDLRGKYGFPLLDMNLAAGWDAIAFLAKTRDKYEARAKAQTTGFDDF